MLSEKYLLFLIVSQALFLGKISEIMEKFLTVNSVPPREW